MAKDSAFESETLNADCFIKIKRSVLGENACKEYEMCHYVMPL